MSNDPKAENNGDEPWVVHIHILHDAVVNTHTHTVHKEYSKLGACCKGCMLAHLWPLHHPTRGTACLRSISAALAKKSVESSAGLWLWSNESNCIKMSYECCNALLFCHQFRSEEKCSRCYSYCFFIAEFERRLGLSRDGAFTSLHWVNPN